MTPNRQRNRVHRAGSGANGWMAPAPVPVRATRLPRSGRRQLTDEALEAFDAEIIHPSANQCRIAPCFVQGELFPGIWPSSLAFVVVRRAVPRDVVHDVAAPGSLLPPIDDFGNGEIATFCGTGGRLAAFE